MKIYLDLVSNFGARKSEGVSQADFDQKKSRQYRDEDASEGAHYDMQRRRVNMDDLQQDNPSAGRSDDVNNVDFKCITA